MKYTLIGNRIEYTDIETIDLARSCFCGQAFRWKETESGVFGCVLGPAYVTACAGENSLTVESSSTLDPMQISRYFDLERSYSLIEHGMKKDAVLKQTLPYATGIRVFAQEPFETLISFIISANNNIKRITKIIDALCRTAGERVHGETEHYTFPAPAAIAELSLDTLRDIGLGYRAPYIKDTAARVRDGFSLSELHNMSYPDAKRALCTLSGVGPKVADCVLLFSLGHGCAFPMDVWMKRAMRELFFQGREPGKAELNGLISSWGEDAGVIQQYIFHYARETELRAQNETAV